MRDKDRCWSGLGIGRNSDWWEQKREALTERRTLLVSEEKMSDRLDSKEEKKGIGRDDGQITKKRK